MYRLTGSHGKLLCGLLRARLKGGSLVPDPRALVKPKTGQEDVTGW
jgi:hypothetical protein